MNTNTLRILVAVAAICTTLACSQKTGKLLPTDLPTDSVSIDTLVYLDANRTAKLTFHIGYQLFADSAMAAANSAIIASDSTLLDYQDEAGDSHFRKEILRRLSAICQPDTRSGARQPEQAQLGLLARQQTNARKGWQHRGVAAAQGLRGRALSD